MVHKDENLTVEEIEVYANLLKICETGIPFFGANHSMENNVALYQFLAPRPQDIFHVVLVRGDRVNIRQFRPTVTELGICYTWNGLADEELKREEYKHPSDDLVDNPSWEWDVPMGQWSLENGYSSTNNTLYPLKSNGAGQISGLDVKMKLNKSDFDYSCGGPFQGFKVLLHPPDEVPVMYQKAVRVPVGQLLSVAVKPEMIITSEELRSYSWEKRQCFYQNERQLKFFKIYTPENCDLECLTNYTLGECGCVGFYMPRENSTPICSGKLYNCPNKVLWSKREFINCNCLPACTSLLYEKDTNQVEYDFNHFLSTLFDDPDKYKEDSKNITYSNLQVFFTSDYMLTTKRSELYGVTDFIANVGGLLGLFMGVSLLSIVEIVYFCTIRFYNNRKFKREETHL